MKEGLQGDPELHVGYRGRIIINPEDADASDFPFVKEFTHKIDGLEANLNDIDVLGIVERVYPISTFQRKDGSEGKRASLILRDDSGSTRVVLWDKSAEVVDQIEAGTILRLEGAYTKEGLKDQIEVHGGGRTGVVIDPKTSIEFSLGSPELINIIKLSCSQICVQLIFSCE